MYQNRKINGSSAKALKSERPMASIVVVPAIRNRDSKDRQSQRRAPGITRVISDGVLHEKAFISDEMPQPTRVDSTILGSMLATQPPQSL